ncbi:MAG: hypothetical protein A3H96_17180 [Acidobacteria bacterium RIFCSPLOWO2_02_FULL_67_36]|nr:MAG: hypothetical protein A3H96_17180 [Acidobacteria bacterium RIFCSPLOWO2_02_FULL_67_36]OFW25749.1 MAG: hypothetical protein A3G21_25065 [Acidobacteria bacterium RIFCSPLOWO2_12_FULL_66_21]
MTAARFRFHLPSIALAFACAGIAAGGCGKKGPPLAPLRLVPAAPADVSLVRRGSEARLRFTIPSTSPNGPGRIDIDRVEIYAVTAAPGDDVPSNLMLMTKKYLVGTVQVKPLPVEGAAPAQETVPDTRPAQGEVATFSETLTPEKLTPAVLPKLEPQPVPATAAPGAAPPTPAPQDTDPKRVYVTRAITRGGRRGPPSVRGTLLLVAVPPPPDGVAVSYNETALSVEWKPPPDAAGRTLSFNVYRKGTAKPLNEAPLAEPKFERPGPEFETEQCFSVRAVAKAGAVPIESEPSADQCVTPHDTFPPAAPKGLGAVTVPGEVDLIWDANAEPDLAGYVVLRGEAPGDKLLPLMTAPLADTKFVDKTVKPGVRYVYAVVAVDKASNPGPQSPRIEETAR